MKLTRDHYTISRSLIEKLLGVLPEHHTFSRDDDEYNNEDVIAADELLQAEVKAQDPAAEL